MDKISLLKSVFIFEELEDMLLEKLSKLLKVKELRVHGTIFKESDPADAFYIVDSGRVTISKHLGEDKEKILAILGPGNVFGEMAFFSDSPRTATAKADTASKLWEIKREDFMGFISEQPKAGLKILSALLKVSMDRLEVTSRELATIFHAGKIISSGKSVEEIAQSIKEELMLAIPEAEDGAIFLYNQFNEEYDPIAAPKKAVSLKPENPLVKIVEQNMSGKIMEDCKVAGKEGFLKGCVSAIFSPVIKDNILLGLIVLWNTKKEKAFKGTHILLLSSVASQLAEAVENIKHRQEEKDRQRLKQSNQYY